MLSLLVNVDVPDLEAAIDFYRDAFGLRLARKLFEGSVAEMVGGTSPIYLLERAAGSRTAAEAPRDYRRHWTPVHLDIAVDDAADAVHRAQAAGATLEGEIQTHRWGRLAPMSDPFGNGVCVIQFFGPPYSTEDSKEG